MGPQSPFYHGLRDVMRAGRTVDASATGIEAALARIETAVRAISDAIPSPVVTKSSGGELSDGAVAALNAQGTTIAAKLDSLGRALDVLPARVAAAMPVAPASTSVVIPSRATRNAVVGMAKNIDLKSAYRFVRSLRNVAPAVDIVIFTDDASGDLGWMYKAFGVNVQHFSVDTLPAKARGFHPSSYRWMLIRDWMKSLPAAEQYDQLFFIDVRDSVFQLVRCANKAP